MYNLFIIELCCFYCYYLNLHNGHKVLPITDEEALKKEDITIDNSTKEFDENMVNINIKNNIEKEITKIDTLYDQVNKETTKSFELKHEELIKEENELKEKLQN